MKIKLAEALLRRKELQNKVDRLHQVKTHDLIYQVRAERIKVTDGIEELNADFPKLTLSEVTAEYDYYARALRLIDGYIQQANWTTELEIEPKCINDFVTPEKED